MRRAPIAVLVTVSLSACLSGPSDALGRQGESAAEAIPESTTVRGPIAAVNLDTPQPSIQINDQGRVRVIPIEPHQRIVYDGKPMGPHALQVGQFVRVRLIGWSGRQVVKSIEIIRPGDQQDQG